MIESTVHIYASVEQLGVRADEPALFRVQMHIDDDAPIYAADPGEGGELLGIVPLRVHVIRGSHIAVYADYPAGAPLAGLPDNAPRVLVCSGTVEFDVAIEQTSSGDGTVRLGVTYQHAGVHVEHRGDGPDEPEMYHDPLQLPRTIELEIDVRCQ